MSQGVGEGRGGVQGTAEKLSALAAADDEDGVAEDAGDDEEKSRRVMGLKSGTGSARWESLLFQLRSNIATCRNLLLLLYYYYYYRYYYQLNVVARLRSGSPTLQAHISSQIVALSPATLQPLPRLLLAVSLAPHI